MRKFTTITVRGDEEFVRACKAYCAKYNIKIGDFVRNAINDKYGSELDDSSIFVAMPDRKIERTNDQLIERAS